jgi:acyl carrier protein
MKSLNASSAQVATVSSGRDDSLRHLPPDARLAFEQFQADRDPAKLDCVILAILDDYIPRRPAQPLAELPGRTLLMTDLGFDSLAITEVVFFVEALFGITILNEEIIQVRTLDDLREFIRRKVSVHPGR